MDNGLITRDILGDVEFEAEGIAYMENRFAGKVSQVLDFIAKIKSTIPFL